MCTNLASRINSFPSTKNSSTGTVNIEKRPAVSSTLSTFIYPKAILDNFLTFPLPEEVVHDKPRNSFVKSKEK